MLMISSDTCRVIISIICLVINQFLVMIQSVDAANSSPTIHYIDYYRINSPAKNANAPSRVNHQSNTPTKTQLYRYAAHIHHPLFKQTKYDMATGSNFKPEQIHRFSPYKRLKRSKRFNHTRTENSQNLNNEIQLFSRLETEQNDEILETKLNKTSKALQTKTISDQTKEIYSKTLASNVIDTLESISRQLQPLYGYYYIERKLWYVPLYFSVYFVIYIGSLVLKAVSRHRVYYPQTVAAVGTAVGTVVQKII